MPPAQPGMPGGWGGPPPTRPTSAVGHRPGPGAIVAVVGLLLFFLAVTALPWASAGDQDATRSDFQEAYEAAQDAGAEFEDEYLGIYAKWLWILMLVFLGVAVLFSTLVVPSSKAGRLVIGFLTGGVVGLVLNAIDDDGRVGPRVTAALQVILVSVIHGIAMFMIFDGPNEPDPAIGIWAGFAGLAVVLFGCVIGTRVERGAPTYMPPPMPVAPPTYR